LITAGVVILTDVGITLAWGEPISALRAWLAQREAADELERLETEFERAGDPFDPVRLPSLAERLERRAEPGDAIGRIRVPAIDVDRVVVEGTDTGSLRDGPGHYQDTVLPGQAGTVGVAGHRTTYGAPFRNIDGIERGDELVLEMPYADFVYRFERSRIVDPSRVGVVRDVGHDRLVLTACHPLYSAAQRYVVFARQVEVRPP
jgi:sortase A